MSTPNRNTTRMSHNTTGWYKAIYVLIFDCIGMNLAYNVVGFRKVRLNMENSLSFVLPVGLGFSPTYLHMGILNWAWCQFAEDSQHRRGWSHPNEIHKVFISGPFIGENSYGWSVFFFLRVHILQPKFDFLCGSGSKSAFHKSGLSPDAI